MKKMLKTLGLAFALTTAALSNAEPLKVGFVYVSPTGEAGWTLTHDIGRLHLEETFGDKIETTFVENVPEGADAERVITQLAKSGHDIIFTTSFGYMNATLKVAKRYPNIKFEHATGYKRADNVATYFDRIYEARYLTGMIAGHMSETDVIGYIGAFPIPEVIRGINAFTLGAQSVNPDIKVKVVWINTWFDPAKEREAADSLINQKADVVTFHTDSPAAVQAAQTAGVYSIGYHSDMTAYGEKSHLSSSVHNWNEYYVERIQAVMDGTWTSTDTWKGISANMTDIAPISADVPEEVVAQVLEAKAMIASGELHPFKGPIINQAGDIVIPAGQSLDDGALLTMDYYVSGVEGKLK
ncbi:BMP family ABC transporter substrate-binding protein [Reinekea sp.]|jgi:basic membrane protein A|uniref:BMP family ABC transporter substrate-binding protein n=1 Tax=Reinekea sp. TaxID=1970455 RepID=UPI003989B4BE